MMPIRRPPRRGFIGNPFTPADLFRGGVNGFWFDPSDLTTLFQDSAGTIPVTAANQPVGKILDKSGNGNHAIQATSSKLPMLRSDGWLWWLDFDGIDDCIVVISFSANTYFYLGVGIIAQDINSPFFIEHSATSTSYPGFFFYGIENAAWIIRRGGVSYYPNPQPGVNWSGTTKSVCSLISKSDKVSHYRNKEYKIPTGYLSSQRSNSSVTDALNIMSRNQSSIFGRVSVAQIIFVNNIDDNFNYYPIYNYISAKSGVNS